MTTTLRIEDEIVSLLRETPGLSAAMISQRLKERSPRGWRRSLWLFAGSATLYPALAKMERAGCLRSQWGMQVNGKPRRRLYFTNPSASP